MSLVSSEPRELDRSEIERLDPYLFMAVIGKRIIHPGGRVATEQLLERAAILPTDRILDAGCGVATTSIEVARRFGASVTAVDISPLMLERARTAVREAGVHDRVAVEEGDILSLPYGDGAFDVVIAEAVTMFVDRLRAAKSLVRVCRHGGRVLATEFMWRRPPSEEVREIFLGQVCPGIKFDDVEGWVRVYTEAGLADLHVDEGPFEMMTARGFVHDEGLSRTFGIVRRVATNRAYAEKMAWLMPRMRRAIPCLGYVVVAGTKPRGGR